MTTSVHIFLIIFSVNKMDCETLEVATVAWAARWILALEVIVGECKVIGRASFMYFLTVWYRELMEETKP